DRGAGHRCRPSCRRGVQRQPRVRGVDHRRQPTRPALRRGQHAGSGSPDLARPHPVRGAGVDLRRRDPGPGLAAHSLAPGGAVVSALASGNGLPGLDRVPVWFNDPSNWWGPDGLLIRIREHLLYTALIVIVAILIALPLGLFIGHTGRGVALVVGLAN